MNRQTNDGENHSENQHQIDNILLCCDWYVNMDARGDALVAYIGIMHFPYVLSAYI